MINSNHFKNFGIVDIQCYFPSYYVDQKELEAWDKVESGKYTIGLGQEKMAFVGDREDINSICLTVLEKLLKRNQINRKMVGRLEVGTETFLDKSKSIKTYLMDFFKEENCDIEGVTTSNACYGGTNALFNAMNWLTSQFYDGRYAIVISADIAIYSKGKARPTGGCGAIAILLGHDSHIQFENIRSTYMNNVYDFYKPNPSSEYPVVDGVFSIDCYFKALEYCYEVYLRKQEIAGNQVNLNFFDYFCFHSPFAKMVEKAFCQLLSYDLSLNKNLATMRGNNYYNEKDQNIKNLIEIFATRERNFKLDPKLSAQIKNSFSKTIKSNLNPSLYLGKNLGNIYTGSLYAGLMSLIIDDKVDLQDKRIFLFSYGSGCASSIFTLKFSGNAYLKIRKNNEDLLPNLRSRINVSPADYEKMLSKKEKLYLSPNYTPQDKIEDLFDGTYYIEKVDELWRRVYVRKGKEERKITYNKLNNKSNDQSNSNKEILLNSAEKRLTMIRNQLGDGKDIKLPRRIVIEDNVWSGFHKKSIHERLMQIKKVYPQLDIEMLKTGGLNLIRADNMIENCIGMIALPVGLCLNLTVNSIKYNVPMAVEEPSVIAAVSNAAKLISENNGFFSYSDPSLMISQVHFIDTNSIETEKYISENKSALITMANSFCQDMVQRGGGVKDLYTKTLTKSESNGRVVIEAIVDVKESMGANTLSTVAEGLASFLQTKIKGTAILKIISNLAIYRKSTAEFKINVKYLDYKDLKGQEVARRIVEAYELAKLDPFRASTHNKGIMNGIDAVALALGQDWRALEASVHSFAALNMKTLTADSYKPLSYYKIIEVQGEHYLNGILTMPISVGVVGGAINSNENYSNMMKLLGNPSTKQLAQILVSIGLAQNFAALRALVSEGIQKGHMGLHARNFAIKVGVPDYLIPDAVSFMKNNKNISVNAAKNYLESFKIYNQMRGNNSVTESNFTKDLSSFYIEIDYSFLKEPIVMNFLLKTKINPPVHFALRSRKIQDDDIRVNEIFKTLFGEAKHEDWLHEFVKFVNHFDFFSNSNLSHVYSLKYKMKMTIILLYLVSYNLLQFSFEQTKIFLLKMLSKGMTYDEMLTNIPNESLSLNFGLSVILELYEIMKFYCSNYVKQNKLITEKIISEVEDSLLKSIKMYSFGQEVLNGSVELNDSSFKNFLSFRLKRLNANVMILSDLAFSDEKIDEETYSLFMALGDYVEIKLMLLRDFQKYKVIFIK
jgi:hydroxymethylglutaryl-CoA synthase